VDRKRKVSQVFNNNSPGNRLRGRPKNRWWNCVQTDRYINKYKIENWKERGQQTELTGRSALRMRRSAMDCTDI